MEKIQVTHTLIRAESIDEFRSDTGKRILKKPYWKQLPGGLMEFEFITAETDAKELLAMIEQGIIYVINE